MTYDLKPMKAPRAAGNVLRALALAAENPATGALLANELLRNTGIAALRTRAPREPLPAEHPLFAHAPVAHDAPPVDLAALAATAPLAPRGEFTFATCADYAKAYRGGRVSPEQVAQRVIDARAASEERNPRMALFIAQDAADVMAQARASAERHRQGRALSPLDGVPVAVKDELDQRPYPTTVGTRFLGRAPATADSEVAARLRAAGALLVGKTNMHEIGLGVTGLNPHYGAARNPYAPARATGGSSSGSAAVVAAGLCPLAVGADGGGSIRIPASLCGVVGLKATYGRVSEFGAAPLCWSVAHVGPIGATVQDVALGYALMAGPDEKDANSLRQPRVRMDGYANGDLRGVRLGVFRAWFDDAEPGVVSACRAMLDALVEAGATVVEIDVPELALLRAVHLVTIVGEMNAALAGYYDENHDAYGYDTRLNLAVARRFTASDYINAQRHRVRLCAHYDRLLEQCDAIVTPAAARTAPLLPPDALATGESDLEVTDQIMRYATPANVTGLPAIAWVAGYDGGGLPVGIQAMGRAWEEHLLLRIARVGEQHVERRRPQVHYTPLGG